MGMTTKVVGFISPNDSAYKKQANVLRACIDAEIEELPKETAEYFGQSHPCETLFDEKLEIKIDVIPYDRDMAEGFEIKISDLPKAVHAIRFINSY